MKTPGAVVLSIFLTLAVVAAVIVPLYLKNLLSRTPGSTSTTSTTSTPASSSSPSLMQQELSKVCSNPGKYSYVKMNTACDEIIPHASMDDETTWSTWSGTSLTPETCMDKCNDKADCIGFNYTNVKDGTRCKFAQGFKDGKTVKSCTRKGFPLNVDYIQDTDKFNASNMAFFKKC